MTTTTLATVRAHAASDAKLDNYLRSQDAKGTGATWRAVIATAAWQDAGTVDAPRTQGDARAKLATCSGLATGSAAAMGSLMAAGRAFVALATDETPVPDALPVAWLTDRTARKIGAKRIGKMTDAVRDAEPNGADDLTRWEAFVLALATARADIERAAAAAAAQTPETPETPETPQDDAETPQTPETPAAGLTETHLVGIRYGADRSPVILTAGPDALAAVMDALTAPQREALAASLRKMAQTVAPTA